MYRSKNFNLTIALLLQLILINNKIYSQVAKMKVKEFKRITPKESRILINSLEGKINEELMKKYAWKVYDLKDGQAIIDFETHAFLHPTRQNILDYFYSIKNQNKGKPKHILHGIFPYDEKFIFETDSLAKGILDKLGIGEFNFRLQSLKEVDLRLNQYLKSNDDLDKLYPGLVALAGKVIINEKQGKWEMRNLEEAQVWEPYVLDNSRKTYNPFLIVYKELYEYHLEEEEEIALFDHTQIELIQYEIKSK